MRPGLAHDAAVAPPAQQRDSSADVHLLLAREHRDLCLIRKTAGKPRGAGLRGEDERAVFEHRVVGRDRPRGGEERDARARVVAELAPEGGEVLLTAAGRRSPGASVREVRRAACRCRSARGPLRRAAAPITKRSASLPAADQTVRARQRRDRDDAVDGGHEVGVEAPLRQPEVTAVQAAKPGRKGRDLAGLLLEDRERLEPGQRASSRNSRRSSAILGRRRARTS